MHHGYLLCPFHVEDKMIITKARHTSDRLCCILLPLVINECKTLRKQNRNDNSHGSQGANLREKTLCCSSSRDTAATLYTKIITALYYLPEACSAHSVAQ